MSGEEYDAQHRAVRSKLRASEPPAASAPHELAAGFWKQVLEGGKIAGPLGGAFGFVGDVLNPLAPFNGLLFVLTLAGAVALGVLYVRHRNSGTLRADRVVPERLLPFSLFLMFGFGVWFVLGLTAGHDGRGAMASHVDALADMQNAILGLREDVAAVKQDTAAIVRGTDRIREDTSALRQDTAQIRQQTAASQQDTHAIREEAIAVRQDTREIRKNMRGIDDKLTRIDEHLQNRDDEQGPIQEPQTKEDFRHNAAFYALQGENDQALAAYRRYFELETGDFYDEFLGYWMFLDKALRDESKVREVFRELLSRPRKGAELVLLEKDRSPKAVEELRVWLHQNPDYVPAYLVLFDKLPRKMLIDMVELSQLQAEYQQRGGFEAARKFLRKPEDGLMTTFLRKFGEAKPLDLSELVQVEFVSEPYIQLLAVGVNDDVVPQRISLKFPGDGPTVTVPLGEENPAGPEEPYVLFELKGGTPGQVRFEPRAENDRRMYKHCGTLYGLNSGRCLVTVSFVDGQGRPFTFPQPVNLGIASFTLRVLPPDPFPMGPPRGPVLEIKPLEFLDSCEIATAKEGPFAPVPQHDSVPTIHQIELTAIPGLALTPGEHEVWIRGQSHNGKAIPSERLTFKIPARLAGLKDASGRKSRGTPAGDGDE